MTLLQRRNKGETLTFNEVDDNWAEIQDLLDSAIASVKDARFGARGNGAANDTAAIQAAVDESLIVYFPPGTYLTSTITLRENSKLFGAGIDVTTILRNGSVSPSQGLFYVNSGDAGTKISGIRISDLTINGAVEVAGFSEFQHLMAFHGVKDLVVERVKIQGPRGDGICIGSGDIGGQERHNENVTIQDCVFDGTNSDNRCGLSVADCDVLKVQRNVFRNLSRATMPGPIDIEPDANIFTILKNLDISNNDIGVHGGLGGSIGLYIPVPLTTPLSGLRICNNNVKGSAVASSIGISVFTAETISSAIDPMSIEIIGNTVDVPSTAIPIWVNYARGVHISENTILGGGPVILAQTNVAATLFMDAVVKGNNFNKNGSAEGSVLCGSVSNLRFEDNVIDSPDNGASTVGLHFHGAGVTTVSSNVSVVGNTFIKGAAQTNSVFDSGHTLDPITNFYSGNVDIGGALTSNFVGVCGTFTPKLWAVGNNTQIDVASATGYFERSDRSMRVRFTFIVAGGGPGAGAGNLWIGGESSSCAGGVVSGGFPTTVSAFPSLNSASIPTATTECYISGVDLSAGYSKCMVLMTQDAQVALRLYEVGDNVAAQAISSGSLAAGDAISGDILYVVV